jgi:hypothetical protein
MKTRHELASAEVIAYLIEQRMKVVKSSRLHTLYSAMIDHLTIKGDS